LILLIVGGCLLAVAAAGFILYPIVRPPRDAIASLPGPSEELIARRDRVYAELRDLEFDYRVGKMTTEDYQDTRNRLELEAARVLQAIDTQVTAIDEEIERQVQQLRAQPVPSACPSCGAPVSADARFCAACGAALTVAANR
jgi:hypothetical protein